MESELRVGALAQRAGLTVRTLHHYDEIGLLRPKRRTAAGHRVYGIDEIRRLQRIASLRQLGLSLAEIRDCLDGRGYGLEEVLELHVARIDDEIEAKVRLRRRIARLLRSIASSEGPSIEELTGAIEATVRYETYFTGAQLDRLARRREAIGDARLEKVQEEWSELFEAFRMAMEEGRDPASPAVRELARRSAELVEEFTGGDAEILESLSTMYREEGPDRVAERHVPPVPPGLWTYMGQARRCLSEPSEDPSR